MIRFIEMPSVDTEGDDWLDGVARRAGWSVTFREDAVSWLGRRGPLYVPGWAVADDAAWVSGRLWLENGTAWGTGRFELDLVAALWPRGGDPESTATALFGKRVLRVVTPGHPVGTDVTHLAGDRNFWDSLSVGKQIGAL